MKLKNVLFLFFASFLIISTPLAIHAMEGEEGDNAFPEHLREMELDAQEVAPEIQPQHEDAADQEQPREEVAADQEQPQEDSEESDDSAEEEDSSSVDDELLHIDIEEDNLQNEQERLRREQELQRAEQEAQQQRLQPEQGHPQQDGSTEDTEEQAGAQLLRNPEPSLQAEQEEQIQTEQQQLQDEQEEQEAEQQHLQPEQEQQANEEIQQSLPQKIGAVTLDTINNPISQLALPAIGGIATHYILKKTNQNSSLQKHIQPFFTQATLGNILQKLYGYSSGNGSNNTALFVPSFALFYYISEKVDQIITSKLGKSKTPKNKAALAKEATKFALNTTLANMLATALTRSLN